MTKKIVIALIFITWPLSLLLANTPIDFLRYIIPVIFIIVSLVLFKQNNKFYYAPIFIIPFIEAKFAILPLLFLILNFDRKKLIQLILSIFIAILFIKPFYGQSVFTYDYEAQQKILQKEKLYPSIFLARLFQNKARIPLTKIINNSLALTDPNNYFFGFAPGQIKVDNQNLDKFPFLSLPFLLMGLYFFNKNKDWKFLLTTFIASFTNLSLLRNFDRNDFILWIPLSLLILYGLNIFNKKFQYAKYYYLIFILFAVIGVLKIFIK